MMPMQVRDIVAGPAGQGSLAMAWSVKARGGFTSPRSRLVKVPLA